MGQVKNDTAAPDSVKRYSRPWARVVFIKARGVLCYSEDNEPLYEYDFGDGGFGTE